MIDRSYQSVLVNDARAKLAEIRERLRSKGINRGPRLMIQLGCGGGKTQIAAMISKSAISKNKSVGFVCHRDFLLEQTSLTFEKNGIHHSFLAAGRRTNIFADAHIGMVGSMKSRMSKIKPPAICFIDEGHHGVAKTWREIVETWPETTFIFLSATPGFRSDGKAMDELCDDIVCGPSNAELIALGALSKYRYFAPTKPDLSKIHTRMGEYVTSEIDDEMSKSVIVGDIVRTYGEKANGTRAIYFATSVKTSEMYAAAFRAAGVPAIHIDADTPAWERKRAAREIALGNIRVMTNVMIAGEGYDIGAQAGMDVTIETVGGCRPTKSFPLLVQMMMRCMRAKPYPGTILDHAGWLDEHNFFPDDDVEWTLSGGKRSNPVKYIECENCGCANPSTAFECVNCHATIERKRRGGPAVAAREVEHVDGELQEIDRAAARRQANMEQGQARTIEDLIALATRRGYKRPEAWAGHIWQARVMKGARR